MATSEEEDRPAPDATRPSLLLRIRDRTDVEAWRAFAEAYTPLVYEYCRRRGLQSSDVSDVTQEVMIQVCRSIRDFSYQPERGRFRDWLGSVVRSKILRFYRGDGRAGKGRGGDLEPGDLMQAIAAASADTLWNESFQARVLEVALGRARPHFADSTWTAFERSWLQGRPASEVAQEIGVPIEKVYVARSRVLKKLQEEVATLAEDFPLLLAPPR